MKRVVPTSVVPFGKYKGQPIEAMAQDKSYLEWLQAQDWFRERYSGIYTLIVNNFSEASETPDHNALQVLFLDNVFCERFITRLVPQWREKHGKRLAVKIHEARRRIVECKAKMQHRQAERRAEVERRLAEDPAYSSSYSRTYDEDAIAKAENEIQSHSDAFCDLIDIDWEMSLDRVFEKGGVDVQLSGCIQTIGSYPHIDQFNRLDDERRQYFTGCDNFRIEIKPTVSDDYPAVLRQMRANGSTVLFTTAYTGVGATEEQFVKTFAISQIKVVFRRDVDAVVLDSSSQCGQLEMTTCNTA